MRDGLTNRAWVVDIHGALTAAVAIQYVSLWRRLNLMTLSNESGRLTWCWTPTGSYTASSCYKAMFIGATADPNWRITWRSWVPLGIKFFVWLELLGRCWTVDRLSPHNLSHEATCLFCDQEPETMQHILAGCSFSRLV